MSRRKRGVAPMASPSYARQQSTRNPVQDEIKTRAAETTRLPAYDPDSKFSVKEYVILNVIFDTFCLFNLVLVHYFLSETRGLYFFFGLLMIGFLIVSVYDYAFDRLATRANEPPAN